MDRVYKPLPDPKWKHDEIKHLLELFPAGQVVLKVNGELAGCALSIIVPEELASKK